MTMKKTTKNKLTQAAIDSNNLKKAAVFTDIHFGRKNSSELHNKDCMKFIEWFIEKAKEHEVDHIIFGGDWFEHRDSISGKTLDYSHKAMRLIKNELGNIPFFFLVGNHDLVFRNTRNAFNTKIFEPFPNMIIIDEPQTFEISDKKVLFCPFLFHDEYSKQVQFVNSHDIVFGHFEFKGFVVTGDTKEMDHGPEHTDFKKCTNIFTGHFHKRQKKDNVYYIGSTFPMDFSDANDTKRGMMIYEYENDKKTFIDWDNAPTYIRCKLSDLLTDPNKHLREKATVSCEADTDVSYDEVLKLQRVLTKKFGLREINIYEPAETYEESEELDEEDLDSESSSVVVKNLLRKVKSKDIKPKRLIELFDEAE